MQQQDGKGTCRTCGFLAKTPIRDTHQREKYTGMFEVESAERDDPIAGFDMVHPTTNVNLRMQFICFRRAADLQHEFDVALKDSIAKGSGGNQPALQLFRDVIFPRERQCAQWCQYVPGLDPREHLMDTRLRELENDRRDFQAALTAHGRWIGYAALILAATQVLTMTPDSFLYRSALALWRLLVSASRAVRT